MKYTLTDEQIDELTKEDKKGIEYEIPFYIQIDKEDIVELINNGKEIFTEVIKSDPIDIDTINNHFNTTNNTLLNNAPNSNPIISNTEPEEVTRYYILLEQFFPVYEFIKAYISDEHLAYLFEKVNVLKKYKPDERITITGINNEESNNNNFGIELGDIYCKNEKFDSEYNNLKIWACMPDKL